MLAAVMRNARLDVATVADPEPGPGQLLVRTRACGICGSDLHALQHGPDLVAMADEAAGSAGGDLPLPMINMDLSRDVVMGHEFVGEVLAAGAGATAHAVGDLVVSMPVAFDAQARQAQAENRARDAAQELYVKIADQLTPTERRAFPAWREHRRPSSHNILDEPDQQAGEPAPAVK